MSSTVEPRGVDARVALVAWLVVPLPVGELVELTAAAPVGTTGVTFLEPSVSHLILAPVVSVTGGATTRREGT